MKKMTEISDIDLLHELGIDTEIKKQKKYSPEEERVILGFGEINEYYQKNKRLPRYTDISDIFEKLLATRLKAICESNEWDGLLKDFDTSNLLQQTREIYGKSSSDIEDLSDEEILSQLGISDDNDEHSITNLTNIKARVGINSPDELARSFPCKEFDTFTPLFDKIQSGLNGGTHVAVEVKGVADVNVGEFFIIKGQKAYIAEKVKDRIHKGEEQSKVRVIYDNGTEIKVFLHSFIRSLQPDQRRNRGYGRQIVENSAGAMFANKLDDIDNQSGTIYVLRSQSQHPNIKPNREILHKIGITTGDVKIRIANAKNDPTFLMDDVEIIAEYKLSNINPVKLENLIHKFLQSTQVDITIEDRFGKPIKPREWFLVPLFIIDEIIKHIKDKSIVNYKYDVEKAKIIKV